MADKGGDEPAAPKVVVGVTSRVDDGQAETAADQAREAYAIAVEELGGVPAPDLWVAGDELSEMMWVQQSKLKEAHEKLLATMAELRESGDLSAEGLKRLQTLLDELAANIESSRGQFAMGRAISLTAPEIGLRSPSEQKIIVEKLIEEGGDGQRQLKIRIDGDEVAVEGEGLSDEELAEIERQIAEGEHVITLGDKNIMLAVPQFSAPNLSEDELRELYELKELPQLELELKELDEQMKDLELQNHDTWTFGAPAPDQARGIYLELLPELHGMDSDSWNKEWQELSEELEQVLTDEQMAKLNKLMHERQMAAPEAADHFFRFFEPGEGEAPLENWEEHHDIFRNYAPHATPFFEWRGQELDGDWEAELQQMMAEIEQMMKQLMLKYQEHGADSV